jgi:hypothetical protein
VRLVELRACRLTAVGSRGRRGGGAWWEVWLISLEGLLERVSGGNVSEVALQNGTELPTQPVRFSLLLSDRPAENTPIRLDQAHFGLSPGQQTSLTPSLAWRGKTMSAPRVIRTRRKKVLLANVVACGIAHMIPELCVPSSFIKANDYETRLGIGLLWATSLER